ncbi:response regulator [bacterium]|nr:response regulator [bacterium]
MADSTAVLTDKLLLELIKNLPAILWFLLVFVVVLLFYKPIRHELLPNLSGFKAMGVEFSFVKNSISAAIKLAEKSEQWKVTIPDEDEKRVLDRVKRHLPLFQDVRVLWIDDNPDSLRNERKMLERLQVDIDLALNDAEAPKFLRSGKYDLILSDIARGNDSTAGLKFLQEYGKTKKRVPFIFYIGTLSPEKGVPPYAFGITNRPDELLHLMLDALERVKV